MSRAKSEPSNTRARVEKWVESVSKDQEPESEETGKDPDVKDCEDALSRCSGSSKTSRSSVRLKDAIAKREIAKRKREQLNEVQRLNLEQLRLQQRLAQVQLDHDIANAEVEAQIWDSGSTKEEEPVLAESHKEVHAKSKLDPNAPEWGNNNKRVHERSGEGKNVPHENPQSLYSAVTMAMNMPKPEILTFGGDPGEYWGFISNFDATIGSQAVDKKAKLTYLIQYCKGKAKESIEGCVLLDPQEGYEKARDILKEQYGQPHLISHALLSKVVNRKPIKRNDGSALWDLSRSMQKCLITVKQMGYAANLDNTDTLFKIQSMLPIHLQVDWAKQAQGIIGKGHEPKFSDMTSFVERAAKTANSLYGQNIGKTLDRSKSDPKHGHYSNRASTFATSVDGKHFGSKPWNTSIKCYCCDEPHSIVGCKEFKEKPQRERLRVVRRHKLCDNCLKPYHLAKECWSKPNCEEQGCSGKHHTLLHWHHKSSVGKSNGNEERNVHVVSNPKQELGTEQGEHVSLSVSTSRRVCLRVLPVIVSGTNGKSTRTWAILDAGSDTSLCKRELTDELGVAGRPISFSLKTITGSTSNTQGLEVALSVSGVDLGETIELPSVLTVDKLPVSTKSMPRQNELDQWPHLSDVELHIAEADDIKLLIGSDVPEAFWVEEHRRGRPKEPYAVRTPLGWTLMGPISSGGSGSHKYEVHHISTNSDLLDQQVKQFWELDHNFGQPSEALGHSLEDRKALAHMEATVKLDDGHYKVGMPWRSYPPDLPNNRQCANTRLNGLKRRFIQDKGLFEKYKETVYTYIKNGHAKEVDQEDQLADAGGVWYLPHHPVKHPLKPDKVRVVFDCAAEFRGVSLNSRLLQGPDLTNSLIGVLLRFRQEKIAMAADVEAMFHQVRVTDKDVNYLRFLWWQDGDMEKPVKEYQMLVHIFGATSSPSCANFALRKTAEDNRDDFSEDVASTVSDNFYVDDLLKSVSSKEQAIQLIPDLCEMLRRGGFRLTKWVSNDKVIMSSVPLAERAKSVVDLALQRLPQERTLGVLWDFDEDDFRIKVKARDVQLTRRGILSAASSLYDPMGFVAPYVLEAKMLLQDLCAQKLGWDHPIGEDEQIRWQRWTAGLQELQHLQVRRCLQPPDFHAERSDLHIFCDASERGYSAVAYLRSSNSAGDTHVAFVMGKARLSPLKRVTIPRLELMAAVLGVQLGDILNDELTMPIRSITYWTDSTAVLQYISNESRRFKTFVANRVTRIHESTNIGQWRYVDTKSNPADDGSRGLDASDLSSECRWLKGPGFLRRDEEDWPQTPLLNADGVPNEELKAIKVIKQAHNVVREEDPLIKLMGKYSSWYRLKTGVAWMLRYKLYLRCKAAKKDFSASKRLTVAELRASEMEIIKWVQSQSFPEALRMASEEKDQGCWKSTTFRKLSPILEDGVLRVGGRLSNSPIDFDQRHPIILPADHQVTRMIIEHHHGVVGHSGAGMTWSSLRSKYWIIRGGAVVRKVIGKCFSCKRRNAARGQQYMADLPADRVTPEKPPFSCVGVDLFGPLLVKQGRSTLKKYGCVFTCMAVRAVHIELVDSLDTDSFINALRRFVSRRGMPERIYSDNGSNFKGGERELREALKGLDEAKVGNFLRQKGIAWQFNPPSASHMGGVWERMIRSIRRIMRAMLKDYVVTQEVLTTVLVEIEAILNSRPLTRLSSDACDVEPLTPNHLLLMRSPSSQSPGVFTKVDSYGKRRWRQCQYLVEQFWRRWIKEYLPLLQERQKWQKAERNFQVNDLVLLVDDNAPRGHWSLGRIVQVFPGRDGLVRQVEVRVGQNSYRRPISKLCLLEASAAN